MEEIIIRHYKNEDREEVRNIAWDTAFIGKSGNEFFTDKEILTDFLTLYFTDYEPESCFIAETRNQVIGYLIAAKDELVLNKVFTHKILAKLLLKFIISGSILKKKNLFFIFNFFISLIKGDFKQPDFHKTYPAVLHINIKEEGRNQGTGAKLIAILTDYLRTNKITGVHLATMSANAAIFFSKQGFNLLHRSKRSYFQYILHKETPIYIFGKHLE